MWVCRWKWQCFDWFCIFHYVIKISIQWSKFACLYIMPLDHNYIFYLMTRQLQCLIENWLIRDYPCWFYPATGCDYNFGSRMVDATAEFVTSKASEDNGMHSPLNRKCILRSENHSLLKFEIQLSMKRRTNTRACEHGNCSLGDQRHINDNAITRLDS